MSASVPQTIDNPFGFNEDQMRELRMICQEEAKNVLRAWQMQERAKPVRAATVLVSPAVIHDPLLYPPAQIHTWGVRESSGTIDGAHYKHGGA